MKKLFIPPVFVLISLLLIVLCYFLFPAYNFIPLPINLLGIIISLCGFIIMGTARNLFRKHQTTLAIERSSALIQESIYKRTRNPMYVGMFLLLLGIAFCFGNAFSVLAAFLFPFAMNFIFVPREEKLMLDAFGQEYLNYKNKVSRWL